MFIQKFCMVLAKRRLLNRESCHVLIFSPLHLSGFTCLPSQEEGHSSTVLQAVLYHVYAHFSQCFLLKPNDKIMFPIQSLKDGKKNLPRCSLLWMLVTDWHWLQYLHVSISKIHTTFRFYFTPQKTQTQSEVKWKPRHERGTKRRQAGN